MGYHRAMPRFRKRCVAVLAVSCLLPGCRHAPGPAPASTTASTLAEAPAAAEPGRAERPAPRPGADVVARVGGEPITRRDLERASYDKPPNEALGSLVESALLRRGAEAKGIRLSEEEVDTAVSKFAASYLLTTERLRANAEAAKIPWSVYLEQVRSQMLESKLVRSRARPGPKDDKDAWLVAWNHERRVVLACLRAETKIEIEDPQLRLPDEPFAKRVHVDGVGIFGAVGPSVDPWIAAAEAAILVDAPLCRAVPAIEDAVMNAMLDAGYLLATVEARWPDSVPSNVTVELDVQTGPLHRVGTVGFDQSMVPAAWRLEVPPCETG